MGNYLSQGQGRLRKIRFDEARKSQCAPNRRLGNQMVKPDTSTLLSKVRSRAWESV